ncbi:hypothetical protein [Ferruginibacter albus]|uniref:hypothetical protein n=1 Tax=Ferruginibacter albus TaxID=2875540 RepID=UPI001CC7ADE1|nr:hypothetical protein [Ferruginibacter albus]UAY50673.1 hypothetical protein K9M53_08705 [Ferruginibacter albus]
MRLKIDEITKFLIIIGVACLYFLSNGIYIFLPVVVSLVLFYFIQQPYKSAILSLMLAWHLLQIVTGPILCNYLEKDIDYDTAYRSTTTILSTIGLIFLFIPIIVVQSKIPNQTVETFRKSVEQFSFKKVTQAYIVAFFANLLLSGIAFKFSGLSQFLFWFADVKWILFSLMGYMAFLQKKNKRTFYLFTLLEFVSGFYSFFSEFKTVIFFVFILLLSLVDEIDIRLFLKVMGTVVLLIFFGIIWTTIKGDYRKFLNGGEKTQRVTVESDAALSKIYELSTNVDEKSLQESITDFLGRIQYTYFFSKAMEQVPDIIPFQNGRNWMDNIEFTTTPRFLNPDKPILDQSAKVRQYTGLHLSGLDKGTSFSLGYFAECYIDFGQRGMMLALLAIGILLSVFYWYLGTKSSKNSVFNCCVITTFFMEFTSYGMDGTYFIGRLFTGIISFYVLIKFIFPVIIKYITIIYKDE